MDERSSEVVEEEHDMFAEGGSLSADTLERRRLELFLRRFFFTD